MNTILHIQRLLKKEAQKHPKPKAVFFKTGKGHYAEHDVFLGVPTPVLRTFAKTFYELTLIELSALLHSPINEERLLALFILVDQYQKSTTQLQKNKLYTFYMKHIPHINNWNLVDSSAHLIVGAHLFDKNKAILTTLAKSKNLWKRRISIIATWYFIRQQDYEWTLKISTLLLNDSHDLIHKSVGWMLREMGKKDLKPLILFLNEHASKMPRTMLRYAIEKLPEEQRLLFLKGAA